MSDPFLRPFIFGVVACAVAAAIVVLAAVELGLVPANADAKPSKLEEWAAKTSLRATINRETDRKAPNPLRPSDESLDAGIDLYATNCGICHGTSDGKKSLIAQGFSIEAPQL